MLQPSIALLEEGMGVTRKNSVAILGLLTLAGAFFVAFFSKGFEALDTLDFSCRAADVVVPISSSPAGFRRHAGAAWTTEENGELVRAVFRKLADEFGPDELPSPDVVAELAAYPSTARCVSVSKNPAAHWTNPVHGFYRGPIKKPIPLRDRIHGPTTAIGIHRQRELPPESENQE
jgi:hypothetical protein